MVTMETRVVFDVGKDYEAMAVVCDYIDAHLDKSDPEAKYNLYVVWKCKILKNWKYLISSTLFDGMYYEVTFDGEKNCWYLDAYKKFENVCVNGRRDEQTKS